MAARPTILDRYRQLPRAGKWAVWAGLLIGGYFLVDSLVLASWRQLRTDADAARTTLENYQERAQGLAGADSAIALGVSRMGDIRQPPPENEGADALRRHIGEVLRGRGLEGFSIRQTGGERLARGVPEGVVDPTQTIGKVRFEVVVAGPPMHVLGALADLERSAIVSAVRQVRLSKEEDGVVGATLIPEIWTIAEDAR